MKLNIQKMRKLFKAVVSGIKGITVATEQNASNYFIYHQNAKWLLPSVT
jgi:hypothetical protein